MIGVTVFPPTSRSFITNKPKLTIQNSKNATVAYGSLSATRPSGSVSGRVEHSNRGNNDVDARSGVCNTTLKTASGIQVDQAQKGVSVYNAADYAGVQLPGSCKQGTCSSCTGKVLEGRVTHSHDAQCLTPGLKAQGYVALSCASAAGDATIPTHQGARLRAARALQLDRMRN